MNSDRPQGTPLWEYLVVLGAFVGVVCGFAGLVGTVWLIVLGEWRLVLVGVGGLFLSVPAISILMLPIGFLLGAATLASVKSQDGVLSAISGAAAIMWFQAVIVAWTMGSFVLFFETLTAPRTPPHALLAIGFAYGPFGYMTSQELKALGAEASRRWPLESISLSWVAICASVLACVVVFTEHSVWDLLPYLAFGAFVIAFFAWLLFLEELGRELRRAAGHQLAAGNNETPPVAPRIGANSFLGSLVNLILAFLACACFAWAGWSGYRFLFTVTDYAGWKWVLSIGLEVGLALLLLSWRKKRSG